MSLAFAVEPLEKCWDEWLELAALQWAETEGYRHYQAMAPSFDRYDKYDKAGWFLMFTARDEGRLVGSCGVYLVPSMHTQALIATEDTWFMRKEYRKGRNAIDFYKFGERELIKRGAVEITVSSKLIDDKPTTGRLLEYLGYGKVAVSYAKRIVRADSAQPEKSADVRPVAAATA
jgi:hypothetical protein